MRPSLGVGFLIWFIATVALRFGGYRLLRADQAWWTIALFAVSFAAMAVAVPRICRALRLDRALWFEAAAMLMLPTLVLDPFSAAFFTNVFPGADPRAAGAFGGWMLMCCAGAVVGVWIARWRQEPR